MQEILNSESRRSDSTYLVDNVPLNVNMSIFKCAKCSSGTSALFANQQQNERRRMHIRKEMLIYSSY